VARFARGHIAQQVGYSDGTSIRMESFSCAVAPSLVQSLSRRFLPRSQSWERGIAVARSTSKPRALGVERQKAIEILDAEIEAFNSLIATYCRT
jgi:hypothetical protein